jgi:glyoxylase-like metal-dependent hydrolase (beta-lactamase superfamily II)
MNLHVQAFHHVPSGTWSYLASDRMTGQAAIIDPVFDYDSNTGEPGTAPAQRLLDAAFRDHLDVRWLLETHAHADHLSSAQWVKAQRPEAAVAIGRGIRATQRTFAPLLGLDDLACDGSQFDRLFDDGDTFRVGMLLARVIATPGHTRDSVAYLIGEALFVGDSLLMPDAGTARCDFPGGDAGLLYRSIQRLYDLPDTTRVFVGHDYGPGGREPRCVATLAEHKRGNRHVRSGVDEDVFIDVRDARDAMLPPPALMEPALRANLRGGALPASMRTPRTRPVAGHPFARFIQ